MPLAIRGLKRKTLDPYPAGWRLRVVPTLGHIPMRMITNGVVDRAGYSWIEDECSRSTVKNTLAILVRVLEQAVRDGVADRNVARVTGWQPDVDCAEADHTETGRADRQGHQGQARPQGADHRRGPADADRAARLGERPRAISASARVVRNSQLGRASVRGSSNSSSARWYSRVTRSLHRVGSHIVTFAACTAARIGEVSGVRAGDIDRAT
jgi:hypothetical protein